MAFKFEETESQQKILNRVFSLKIEFKEFSKSTINWHFLVCRELICLRF